MGAWVVLGLLNVRALDEIDEIVVFGEIVEEVGDFVKIRKEICC